MVSRSEDWRKSFASHLTARLEESEGSPASGLLEVGRLKDDVRRLSAEFERDNFEVRKGSGRSDVATDSGGSGEGDFVDVGVLGEGLATGRGRTLPCQFP
jgi:hypothetical protein